MYRLLDILISSTGILLCLPIFVLIFLVGIFDTGVPLFFQRRVGRFHKQFILIKFRTMRLNTPDVASHLASVSAVTKWGAFLRRTKLDEIPQLVNVLAGSMSLVGPRPCLLTQSELLTERARLGVLDVRPGITGLAQILGVDMSEPVRLARLDAKMIKSFSVKKYFQILLWTALGKGRGDRVRIQ